MRRHAEAEAMATEEKAPKRRGRSRSLICCTVCLIVFVVFNAALIGGAVLAFNHFVSPYIGGVKFGEVVSLLSGISTGAKEEKVVTEGYAEEDLDRFYAELNTKLYQHVKTDAELEADYNALPQEEKDAISPEEYFAKNKYTITISKIMEMLPMLDQGESGGAGGEMASLSDRQREAVDNYVRSLEASTDVGDGTETGTENEALTALLKELEFDFSPILDYDHTADGEDEALTTFQIDGKQIGALVNDVLTALLDTALQQANNASGEGAESTGGIDLSGLPLSEFFRVPQVILSYANERPGADAEESVVDAYEKSVFMALTLQLKIHDFLNHEAVTAMFSDAMASMGAPEQMNGIVPGFIKGLLPKQLFLTVGIYPLDNTRDLYVRFNSMNDKQVGILSKVVNSLTETLGFSLLPEEDTEGEGPQYDVPEDAPFLTQVNAMVGGLLQGVTETVPVSFVPVGEEGNRAGLRLAHIQMLLSLMGIYNPEDIENSVTPHAFLSTLKCLLDEKKAELGYTEEDLNLLYAELEAKYGVNKEYWEEHSLLEEDAINDLPAQIAISNVDFNQPSSVMRVNLYDSQLAALVADAIESGLLMAGSGEVAAAAEGEGAPAGDNVLLDALHFKQINIELVETHPVKGELYRVGAVASISLADLMGAFLAEGDNPIVETLAEALPEGITLGINLYIQQTGSGEDLVRVIGAETGHDTGVVINKFDEQYSKKSLDTIMLMVSSLGDDELSLDDLTAQIEDVFAQIFDLISENLYCEVELHEDEWQGDTHGALQLPSLYELVRGFSKRFVAESEGALTDADVLSVEEIQDLFKVVYNYHEYAPNAYVGTPADAVLSELQDKYYLNTQFTAEELFNGNIAEQISADSLRFNPTTDKVGLYTDTRALSELNVAIQGGALAQLINDSGMLEELTDGSVAAAGEGAMDSLIKSVSVVNCEFVKEDLDGNGTADGLAIKLILRAVLKEESVAAAGEGEGMSFSVEQFLPEDIYLTARVLLYAEDYSQTARFHTEIEINDRPADNFLRLVKVFAGADMAEELIGNIETAMDDAFAAIEDSIVLVYDVAGEQLQLGNIFATINKLAHSGDGSYTSDPADDLALANRLREFGRNPEVGYHATHTDVVWDLDVDSWSNSYVGLPADSDAFFADINRNFYIADGKEITADNIQELNIDAGTLDFTKLYQDTTPYAELRTQLTDRRMGALIESFIGEATIPVEGVGEASVLALHVAPGSLTAWIQVKAISADPEDIITKILPPYLYLQAEIDLDNDYATSLCINDMTKEETQNLFDRLVDMATSFGIEFEINLDDLTSTVSEQIRPVFEDTLSRFGGIEYTDGAIVLPTLFDFLVDGSYAAEGEDMAMYEKTPYEFSAGMDALGMAVDSEGYYLDGEGNRIKTDPEALRADLQAFGSAPALSTETLAAETPTVFTADGVAHFGTIGKDVTVVRGLSAELLALANESDNVFAESGTPGSMTDNAARFFHYINRNFYIAEGSQISTDNMEGTVTIGADFIDFASIYGDTRDLEDMRTYLDGAALGAIASLIYPEGIALEGGNAHIVQMHLYHGADTERALDGYYTLQTIVRVTMEGDGSTNAMPGALFVTALTIIDPAAPEGTRYKTELVLNNMGDAVGATLADRTGATRTFFSRLNVLAGNFGIANDLTLDSVSEKLKEPLELLFDEYLGIFGKIKYEAAGLRLPSLYEYLCDGKLKSEGGNTYYSTEDADRMKDSDGSYTDPEDLMYRLREFGAADTVADLGNNLYAWQDGRPTGSGVRYNANQFDASAADDFYRQLQAYYFFRNRPTADMFGNNDIFADIAGAHISDTFNLTGIVDLDHDFTAAELAYRTSGLYNYAGEQYGVKLSDRALGAIINAQGADGIEITNATIQSIRVTSFTMLPVDANRLSIELTVLATLNKSDATSALPSKFYMTVRTLRDTTFAEGDPARYTSQVTVNRFDFGEGGALGGFDELLNYNIAHLAAFDIASQINTDSVAESVESALASMFDTKMTDYMAGFGAYDAGEQATHGVGYMEFYSFYHQAVNHIESIDRAAHPNADKDLQMVIYKLHNINPLLSVNPSTGTEAITYENKTVMGMSVPVSATFTDRAIANVVLSAMHDDEINYITSAQGLIFTGSAVGTDNHNAFYTAWQQLADASLDDEFAFADGKTYVALTVNLHLDGAGVVATELQVLPDDLKGTVMLELKADGTCEVVGTFFNDLLADEFALLGDFITDSTSELAKVEDTVKDKINDELNKIIQVGALAGLSTVVESSRFANLTFVDGAFVDTVDYVGQVKYSFAS